MIKSGTDYLAFAIFALAVIVRALLQGFGGSDVGDVSWVTTFAATAAVGVGITGRLNIVEKNTNGKADAEREEIAAKAAERAVSAVILDPNVNTGSAVISEKNPR